ncbi:MAG: rhodanese-like domain-containing protein [Anaerolineales bacterium]|nr:rhodanese-like domain-containing protein [Anaerolineales bacterium]
MKKIALFSVLIVLLVSLAACGGATETAVAPSAPDNSTTQELPVQIDVQTAYELSQQDDVFMLDVREQDEYDEKHIPDITLIPMSELQSRVDEIPTDKTVVVTCRSGNRSGQVTDFLRQNGFDNVHNMQGGINEWEAAGFAVER